MQKFQENFHTHLLTTDFVNKIQPKMQFDVSQFLEIGNLDKLMAAIEPTHRLQVMKMLFRIFKKKLLAEFDADSVARECPSLWPASDAYSSQDLEKYRRKLDMFASYVQHSGYRSWDVGVIQLSIALAQAGRLFAVMTKFVKMTMANVFIENGQLDLQCVETGAQVYATEWSQWRSLNAAYIILCGHEGYHMVPPNKDIQC